MEIKLPLYNILNFLLVGFVFIGCLLLMFPETIAEFVLSDFYEKVTTVSETLLIFCVVAISYEIGFVLNRMGSVFIEPIFKKLRVIPFNDDYKMFNEKSKEYPIMKTLSREYAVSRTSSLLFAMLMVIAWVTNKKFYVFIFMVCMVVFILSCRKHASKIVDLMRPKD